MIAITSSYVRARTAPSEKILAGTPAIYFTAERDPATKYYEPHPLVTDDPKIQRRIIADLERNRVRCFVRSTEWGQFKSSNDARASGDIYFTIRMTEEQAAKLPRNDTPNFSIPLVLVG